MFRGILSYFIVALYVSDFPNVSQSLHASKFQTRDDRPRREISGSCCPVQTSSKFKLVRFIRQKSFPMCAEAGGGGGFSSCRSVREIYQSRSQLSRQHGRFPQCRYSIPWPVQYCTGILKTKKYSYRTVPYLLQGLIERKRTNRRKGTATANHNKNLIQRTVPVLYSSSGQ